MCVLILQSAIKELILRDSFYAPEVEIFRAVYEWVQANPDENANDILSVVRLPLMTLSELLGVVRPAGLVSPDTILDAIQARTQARDSELNYRGCLSEYSQLWWTLHWIFFVFAKFKIKGSTLYGCVKRFLWRQRVNVQHH
jgi:hypothetical protein